MMAIKPVMSLYHLAPRPGSRSVSFSDIGKERINGSAQLDIGHAPFRMVDISFSTLPFQLFNSFRSWSGSWPPFPIFTEQSSANRQEHVPEIDVDDVGFLAMLKLTASIFWIFDWSTGAEFEDLPQLR
jgi:hypothetical protein